MRLSAVSLLVSILLSAPLQAEPATIHPGNPSIPEENYRSLMWDALEQLPDDETADGSAAHKAIADALQRGADPNDYAVFDGVYSTPIIVAVRRQNLPLLRLLLDKNADPNRPENRKLASTIISVDRPDLLQLLIENGWKFDPNLPGGCASHGEGWPRLPLHAAVSSGSTRMVEALLKLGADPCLTETSNPDWAKRASSDWKPKKENVFEQCDQLTENCPPAYLEENRIQQGSIRKILEPYLRKSQCQASPSPKADNGANPPLETRSVPICITDGKTPKPDWNARIYLYSIRCPLPYRDWTDRNGCMVILLDKKQTPALCLETPAGRVNDILIDEKRQFAVVSLQVDKATPVIYIVSLQQKEVWAVDANILINAYDARRPAAEKDPQDLYARSSFQLIGLRQTDGAIEGLVRHRSALNPQETGLSMLIRFSIDLDAHQPAAGKPWPVTVTQVEDSKQEREWNPGNRDFNPPLVKSEHVGDKSKRKIK